MKTNFDIIVAGGGFAGVAAAISAARRGADVLLIEKYNALGGAAVSLKNNTSVKDVDIKEVRSILREEGFVV